jgi:hypothetical protein
MRTCFFALLATAASAPAAEPVKGVALHEWGVFTVLDGSQTVGEALREEWKSLPPFVFGVLDGRKMPLPPEPTAVKKPVIPGGRPMVWWPADSSLPQRDGRLDERSLTWRFTTV